jgi:type I restriction enzyme S subunit
MTVAWPQVPFNDALVDVSRTAPVRLTSDDYLTSGSIPIIDQGAKPVGGYWNRFEDAVKVTNPLIIFGDHTKALKFVNFDFCVGAEGLKILEPRRGFDANFLFQFLRTIRLPELGYSRHFKYLQRVVVPKPPLDEQQRIAAILDQADDLRRKRRLALEKLDALLTSAFFSFFGDPLKNERGWKIKSVGDLEIHIADGNYAEKYPAQSDFVDHGVPFVRAENLRGLKIDETNMRYISVQKHAELRKGHLQENDVLLTTRGRIGEVALVPARYSNSNVNAQIVILRSFSRDVSPLYLAHLFRIYRIQHFLESYQTGVALKQLPIRALKTVPIPLPPIAQQQSYEKLVSSTSEITSRMIGSLSFLDRLFASLQYDAFSGTLKSPHVEAMLASV